MKIHNDNLDTIDASHGAQIVIDRLNELAKTGRYVFRGYGKQDELLPNIIRKGNYVDIEDKLLKDFEKYGSSYFHATTPIDFMSYAQHFGLPTRLLDFTRNPFIALSFALYSPKSNGRYNVPEDKEYYYVRYASLDDNLCAPSIPLREDIYNNKLTRTDSLAVRACQGASGLWMVLRTLLMQPSVNRKKYEITPFSSLTRTSLTSALLCNRDCLCSLIHLIKRSI